jgi:hypothetical protein
MFDTPRRYELRVAGKLGPASAVWFEDMSLHVDDSDRPVQTIIRGAVRDTAALYGLISRICDLGLTLLSVNPVDEREG